MTRVGVDSESRRGALPSDGVARAGSRWASGRHGSHARLVKRHRHPRLGEPGDAAGGERDPYPQTFPDPPREPGAQFAGV